MFPAIAGGFDTAVCLITAQLQIFFFNSKSEFYYKMLKAFVGLWCAERCEQLILWSLLPTIVRSLMDVVPYRFMPLPVCFSLSPASSHNVYHL